MPLKSMMPCILQDTYPYGHKAECRLPGDKPDHAERTAEIGSPFHADP